MAHGAQVARLRSVLTGLEAGAATRRLPAAISGLRFHVPSAFHERRTWEVMRRELPRLVYANPSLRVDVEHSNVEPAHATVDVIYASMPQRTIVFGDKSASEVMRELLTIGQFAST